MNSPLQGVSSFADAGTDIKICIYAGNPRQYFDVNPLQVYAIYTYTPERTG